MLFNISCIFTHFLYSSSQFSRHPRSTCVVVYYVTYDYDFIFESLKGKYLPS